MKTVKLEDEKLGLEEVINIARKEPVLVLTPDGKEFLISEADDFEKEVEALRGSLTFQKFLDERLRGKDTFPLEEVEKEIEKELAERGKSSK
ncbi:MAG: hypothetical protein IH977_09170 [Nitrospinae bacterium]|nr:hypothetical protein [Nitrospinota bacterium]